MTENPDSTAEFLSIVEEIQGLKNLEKGKDIWSLIQLLNCFVTPVLGSQNVHHSENVHHSQCSSTFSECSSAPHSDSSVCLKTEV